MGSHLPYQPPLPVYFELQFPLIEQNQRLTFIYDIANVDEHLIDTTFYLRTQRAFFEGV